VADGECCIVEVALNKTYDVDRDGNEIDSEVLKRNSANDP